MKVFLLASGDPQKLAPIGEMIPSPMISLLNRPLMEHAVELAARQSYKHIYAGLHNLPGAIEAYFDTGQRWGVKLEYLLQRDQRGSAGAVKWAQRFLDETFLVFPADRVIDLEIAAALEQHRSEQNELTVIANKISYSSEQPLALNGGTAGGATLYATGAYLVEPRALEFIPSRARMDIQTQLVPLLLEAGLPVGVHCMGGYWNPVNTFHEYFEAQTALLHSQWSKGRQSSMPAPSYYRANGRQLLPGIWAGKNASIHPSAQVIPPVIIGDNAQVGRGVEIGPDTAIGANVIVDEGATVEASIILDHTYLGQFVNVKNRAVWQNTVVDIATASSIKIADQFLINSLEKTPGDSLLTRVRDAALALVLLAVTLPVTLPLAAMLLLTTGRAFETLPRAKPKRHGEHPALGADLRYFQLARFAAGRKDGSTSGVSRWVKRAGMARIPELWNVIMGDLNLVGVHPLAPEAAARPAEPWQEKLREMTPGMTGQWYIQSIEPGSDTEMQVADAYYAATRGWRKDWQILLQTPRAWLRHRGASRRAAGYEQAVTEGQTSAAQPRI